MPHWDVVGLMRVIVALVVVGVSLSLSGCSRPPQAKSVRTKWVPPQSQQSVPKFTKATAGKTVTKASRPVSKRSKKLKTHLAKPARRQIEAPASAERHCRQGSLSWPQQPMRNHRRLFRQGSLSWLIPNLRQSMRNHRRLFRQESLSKHSRLRATLGNTLSSPRPSSWPLKKRQRVRGFTRSQARTFRA